MTSRRATRSSGARQVQVVPATPLTTWSREPELGPRRGGRFLMMHGQRANFGGRPNSSSSSTGARTELTRLVPARLINVPSNPVHPRPLARCRRPPRRGRHGEVYRARDTTLHERGQGYDPYDSMQGQRDRAELGAQDPARSAFTARNHREQTRLSLHLWPTIVQPEQGLLDERAWAASSMDRGLEPGRPDPGCTQGAR